MSRWIVVMVWLLGSCAPQGSTTDESGNPAGSSGVSGNAQTNGSTGAGTGASGETGETGATGDDDFGPVIPPTGSTTHTEPSPNQVFSSAIQNITIEIDYMTNAVPYVGTVGLGGGDTWDFLKDNLNALFDGASKTITVPSELAQMEQLTDVTGTDFTVLDILDVADAHRNLQSSGNTATYYFVFLDGYFHDGTSRQTNVLGVSLGATAIVAIFKPVIESTGGLSSQKKIVEQATLTHEFGHAAGLVDNGLAMQAAHRDTAHGRHCSNTECGMYYANESPSALSSFLIGRSSKVIFDSQCLNDAHTAFSR